MICRRCGVPFRAGSYPQGGDVFLDNRYRPIDRTICSACVEMIRLVGDLLAGLEIARMAKEAVLR